MSAPKLEGGPGDGAEIWRQWHFAVTSVGIDLRLDDSPPNADDTALAWTFSADALVFLTMVLRQLGQQQGVMLKVLPKVEAVLDELLKHSIAHDASAN